MLPLTCPTEVIQRQPELQPAFAELAVFVLQYQRAIGRRGTTRRPIERAERRPRMIDLAEQMLTIVEMEQAPAEWQQAELVLAA